MNYERIEEKVEGEAWGTLFTLIQRKGSSDWSAFSLITEEFLQNQPLTQNFPVKTCKGSFKKDVREKTGFLNALCTELCMIL